MKNTDTKNNFITAFWTLYGSKPLAKISVRELCQLAGYNRTTFYAHFLDIYDLLDQAIDHILEPSKNTLLKFPDFSSALMSGSFIYYFYKAFQANGVYIEKIMQNHHDYILGNKIKKIILPLLEQSLSTHDPSFPLEYVIEYQLSAGFGVFRAWVQNKKDMSEQELIRLLYQISASGVYTILNSASHVTEESFTQTNPLSFLETEHKK